MDKKLQEKWQLTFGTAKEVVFGQDELFQSIFAALVCEGHILIEGFPGIGKTLSVSVASKLCDLDFKRIQFTPDLLPSDLIGTMIFDPSQNNFKVRPGPIFTQVLLADEINRAPAKVQSALLEAMEERQVTIGEKSYQLSKPFTVLATQNPIEYEGTYPLPEAQLDRFMMKVKVGYPPYDQELKIMEGKSREKLAELVPTLFTDDLLLMKQEVEEVYVDQKIKNYIVKIISATRPDNEFFLKEYHKVINIGASPRASIWLYKLARFMAYMEESDFVTPEHVLKIVPSVLGHRVIMSYEASVEGIKSEATVYAIAEKLI